MHDGESEIDDPNFFFATNGKIDSSAELNATLEHFFSDEIKDDNSSVCRFPARYEWLKEKLGAEDFPQGECREYNKVFHRVDPKSVTLVFPSAHINSPASMFGHTFLRINSSYNSRLLSYAINYAADANTETENGVVFAIKGLFGGYYGKYSLLPYYEKLKEYRDSEQRDIWEYDLNLTQDETMKMFRHIWELNGTHSYYYFFTENCSYNMLWLLELSRPSLHLREYFNYQVIPLETVHACASEKIIQKVNYRPSKRTKLLHYEKLLNKNNLQKVLGLTQERIFWSQIVADESITLEQRQYILEVAVEYLEYQFSKGEIKKDDYLRLFHSFTTKRAELGSGKDVEIETSANPVMSHRAVRAELGLGSVGESLRTYIGIRPAYHDLEDSNYGFLRGTQIEFMNILLSYSSAKEINVEKATIISIVSLAQRSAFFKSFSWRTKFGWDNDYLNENSNFYGGIGGGYSWGNEMAFIYFMIDPLFYVEKEVVGALGGSIGMSLDKYKFFNTNIELTHRFYSSGEEQNLVKFSQGFRFSQNFQLLFQYDYKEKKVQNSYYNEDSLRVTTRYYF
ncbi:DUF4105 domain-containing protein [Sulfurimonas sp. SAG-AH-194-C20]|nr:DUF4105 domain-containing protein [Sulfurimonas sp. SAG-AH-194-C20]MDF1878628.1 DUF4105 domain-containing protein [Sulfurimonas sp. SAG-AH-194-C20]